MVINFSKLNFRKRPNFIIRNFDGKAIGVLGHIIKPEAIIRYRDAYTGPRAPSARSISPTLPERSPTIPRAVLEERPCQPQADGQSSPLLLRVALSVPLPCGLSIRSCL